MFKKQILGMHDWSDDWGQILKRAEVGGWCCVTEAIGSDPKDDTGRDYRRMGKYSVEPIVRLNHAYGQGHGTIPKPEKYQDFAIRCARFVAASKGCHRWIIGNETNMKWESPYSDGRLISVDDYARCFALCREAIRKVQPFAQVMPAPVAPWNAEQGDWLDLQRSIWSKCWPFEGIAIHAYTHGHDATLVTSDATMNAPYDKHCYHFRVYRDFLKKVPVYMNALPVYITESNPDGWVDGNNAWIQHAAKEIHDWNQAPGAQQIHALCLYRWPDYDREQFTICNKPHVITDFIKAVEMNVVVGESTVVLPTEPARPVPAPVAIEPAGPVGPAGPSCGPAPVPDPANEWGDAVKEAVWAEELFESVTVVNVRNGPGLAYDVVDQLMAGEVIRTKNRDGDWVKSERGWSCTIWNGYTLLKVVRMDNWGRALEHVFKWEGGYVNDPRDPGGETNMGISKRSYPHLDIPNLRKEEAAEIYRRDYWMKSGANELEWPLCLTHFDFAVNAGTWRAEKTLDESEGDVERYNELRENFYRSIGGFIHFGVAWLRRVGDARKAAQEG